MSPKIIEVKDLNVSFFTDDGEVCAVDGVSFDLAKAKTLCIVGESGCGKSVTSLALMRLIASPPGKIVSGQVLFEGTNLLKLSQEDMRKIRGSKISMIFQEPMTSLNPVFSIGNQICEAVLTHQNITKRQAYEKAIEMLKAVGISTPEERMEDYPHQLSGGMRQRVMIAMALVCQPAVLIADEPTTALDVTIQAQILELLKDLQKKMGMSLILITHDLGVVAEMADDVIVMYAGKVVERATVQEIFSNPKHPYTQGLLRSVPRLSRESQDKTKKVRLETIPGIVPNLLHLPRGCRFQERCQFVQDQCKSLEPELKSINQHHEYRCIL